MNFLGDLRHSRSDKGEKFLSLFGLNGLMEGVSGLTQGRNKSIKRDKNGLTGLEMLSMAVFLLRTFGLFRNI
jgi:hypothetical protein